MNGGKHILNYLTAILHAISKENKACLSYVIHLLGIHAFIAPFSKTGNKYVLLSYFQALKNPLLPPLSRLCSEGCAVTQPFFPHNGYLLFEGEGEKSHGLPASLSRLGLLHLCKASPRLAGKFQEDADNIHGHRGKSCRQQGTKPALLTSTC